MGKTNNSGRIGTLFTLFVFCVFAMSVLIVLMLGGNIYKNTVGKTHAYYDERTCLSYVWTKVKNGDQAGMVYVEDFYGVPALCLEEEYDGVAYKTRIYQYDGWVYELFGEADLEFDYEDGTQVMPVVSLVFTARENGLIEAAVNARSMFIFPRGKTAPF